MHLLILFSRTLNIKLSHSYINLLCLSVCMCVCVFVCVCVFSGTYKIIVYAHFTAVAESLVIPFLITQFLFTISLTMISYIKYDFVSVFILPLIYLSYPLPS